MHAQFYLVEKPEWKRPSGIARHRWEDNIKINLKEISRKVWTGFIWYRLGTGDGFL
jgi:hypothetical protein